MTPIYSPNAPQPIGPYSQAIFVGNMLYCSGSIPTHPVTGSIPEGIEAQAEQAIANLSEVLKSAGLGFEQVVKTTCFLANMDDFAAFNAVYSKYFISKPARSCVAVKTLPKNVLVEIELIAVKQ